MAGNGRRRAARLLSMAGVVVAAAVTALAPSAAAGVALNFKFHEEGSGPDVIESFCDVAGLTVDHTWSLDMMVHAAPHGPDRLDYYVQHGVWRDTYTVDGRTVTAVANVMEKDQLVTDNGDGTLTIVILATGNATAYGPDGKAIARNPGQLRFVITIEADGSLTFGDVVKESTGRSDDFCEAAVAALTG